VQESEVIKLAIRRPFQPSAQGGSSAFDAVITRHRQKPEDRDASASDSAVDVLDFHIFALVKETQVACSALRVAMGLTAPRIPGNRGRCKAHESVFGL
jgi:hypothetical protein